MITWGAAYRRSALMAGVVVLCTVHNALSETSGGNVPDVFRGFSLNRDVPLQIEGMSVQAQGINQEIYRGDVRIVRGGTTVRCKFLTVYYAAEPTAGSIKAIGPRPLDIQNVWKSEAKGGVLVKYDRQVVTGEFMVVDFKENAAN